MRSRKIWIILTLGFLVGISILLYPAISDFWNSKTQSRAIVDYESVLDNLDPADHTAIFEKAHAYNEALYRTAFPLIDHHQVPGYFDTLSIADNGMIGYLANATQIGEGGYEPEGSALYFAVAGTYPVSTQETIEKGLLALTK